MIKDLALGVIAGTVGRRVGWPSREMVGALVPPTGTRKAAPVMKPDVQAVTAAHASRVKRGYGRRFITTPRKEGSKKGQRRVKEGPAAEKQRSLVL